MAKIFLEIGMLLLYPLLRYVSFIADKYFIDVAVSMLLT